MAHVTPVTERFLPFCIVLKSGEPISDQVVYGVGSSWLTCKGWWKADGTN